MSNWRKLGWLRGLTEYLFVIVPTVISTVLTILWVVGYSPALWVSTLIIIVSFAAGAAWREHKHRQEIRALREQNAALTEQAKEPDIEIVDPHATSISVENWLFKTGEFYGLAQQLTLGITIYFDIIHRSPTPHSASLEIEKVGIDWGLQQHQGTPTTSATRMMLEPNRTYPKVGVDICVPYDIPDGPAELSLLKGQGPAAVALQLRVGHDTYPFSVHLELSKIHRPLSIELADNLLEELPLQEKHMGRRMLVLSYFKAVTRAFS